MNDVRLFKIGMGLVLLILAAFLVKHNLQDSNNAGVPASALNPPMHPTQARNGPVPSPRLSPREVVQIQVEAIRENTAPENAGIGIAFRFASPQNRKATGPVEHFASLLQSPAYKPLTEYEDVSYGPLNMRQGVAEQLVSLQMADGKTVSYVFLLQLQNHPSVYRCWMTEGVMRLPDQVVQPPDPGTPAGVPI